MSSENIELVSYTSLLMLAITLVIMGLMRELAPAQKSQWFLGIALGTGVAAFALKILFVVTFSAISIPFLDLVREPKSRSYSASAELDSEIFRPNPIQLNSGQWQALPLVAPSPIDNPTTPEKIALGQILFFDKRLSLDSTLACASCHKINADKAGADGSSVSTGIYGQQGDRNAPTVLNAAFQRLLFWDGRAKSLEQQALGPFINPVEMGMPDLASLEARVKSLPEYSGLFERAFPDIPQINSDNIAKAIAAFERTLITPNSPYDRFVQGDQHALTQKQIRGMALFQSLGCRNCHSGPNFSDASVFGGTSGYRIFPANPKAQFEQKYQFGADIGLAIPEAMRTEDTIAGRVDQRGLIDQDSAGTPGIWRIPSLRNVARTAPYFHNGSVDTLEEAVRIMASMQLDKRLSEKELDDKTVFWTGANGGFNEITNRALSDNEVSEIVAFLQALNGPLPKL